MVSSFFFSLPTLESTALLASRIASLAEPGEVIALLGDLGSGKTAFSRFFINSLEEKPQEVPSPTFTLVQTYDTPKGGVWHFDLYRLKRPEEAWELGIEEALNQGISLIEWPQVIEHLLPDDRLVISLCYEAEKGEMRSASLTGFGGWGAKLITLQEWCDGEP